MKHRRSIQSHAEVGPPLPIAKIMTRVEVWKAEIGDLVLPQSGRFKPLDGTLVHACNDIFVRHETGAIARATLQYFAAQARVFVYLQHVHAGVRDLGRDESCERLLPGGEGLP